MDTNRASARLPDPNVQFKPTRSSKAATRGYKTRGRDQLEIKELAQPERRHDGIELSHEPNLESVNYHTTILRRDLVSVVLYILQSSTPGSKLQNVTVNSSYLYC